MTCGHCTAAVTAAVGALAGVTDVDIDLATGAVTITSHSPLEERQVAKAIADAGYELITAAPAAAASIT